MTIEDRVIVFIDVHNYSMAFGGPLESGEFLQAMYERLGAVQKHAELLNELHWSRYVESITVLGTEWAEA
jgi:hypothetical protein